MTMNPNDLLLDGFARIQAGVHRIVRGLDLDALTFRPAPDTNSIDWLVWHLTRIQDDHVSELADREQAWIEAGFVEKFGLPFPALETGYGHSSAEVGLVQADAELLVEYHDAVHARTREFLSGVTPSTLDRIVDRSWNPPVSEGVRLVSVVSDSLQHMGQAAYVKGLLP